jgi:hypothetical protein
LIHPWSRITRYQEIVDKQAGSPKQMLEYVKLGKGHITIIEAGDVDAQVG